MKGNKLYMQGSEKRTWVWILTPTHFSYVILGQLIYLSGPMLFMYKIKIIWPVSWDHYKDLFIH